MKFAIVGCDFIAKKHASVIDNTVAKYLSIKDLSDSDPHDLKESIKADAYGTSGHH
jgi:predicted dehydrogenase